MADKKAVLRKEILDKIRNLSTRKEESFLIIEQIKALKIYQDASLILAFHPLATEPDITPLLSDERIALPYIENDTMFFSKSKNLIKTKLGFLEPDHIPIKIEKSVMLTPLVAFDEKLYRLGRGGGFYDRFISKHREYLTVVGVAFSQSYVGSTYPEEFDQRLDYVICPTLTSVENADSEAF